MNSKKTTGTRYLLVLVMILGAVMVTLYSHSSPFYLMNTWVDVDGNLTIGKCIANGIVVYRDIFEQRGPLFYFLHAFAYLISRDSFLGIWVLEMLCTAGFVFAVYKILALYEHENNIVFLPFLLFLIYSSRSFGLGGSPEEFCLPLIAGSLYLLLKALKEGRLLTVWEYFGIGLFSGAVLWIKFSMLGFYIGSVIPVLFLIFYKKEYRNLLDLITGVCGGVALISLPVFLYFAVHNALDSLFHVYFYINLNYYPFNDSPVYKLYFAALGLLGAVKSNWKYWIVTAIGLIQLFRIEKRPSVIAELIFGAAGLTMVIYSGGQQFAYYALILSVYSIFGLLAIPKTGVKTAAAALLASIVLAVYVGIPKYNARIRASKNDYVQYRFAAEMDENATLLNYQFLDGGFFFAADILPTQYYSWSFNVLNDEIREEQNRYVAEGTVSYIVAIDHDVEEADVNHRYELIDEADEYFLYRRID